MWVLVAALFFLQTTDFNAEGFKALEGRNYEAAVQFFTRAIQADPKDYSAHFNLALAYGFLHKDAEGVAEYRKTLELKPGLYEAQLNGGILLMRQKNPADALPLFEGAASQKPEEFRPRYYLAEARLQAGDAERAEQDYRLALGIDPQSAPSELGLAHALAKQGKLADADPHFRKAAELDHRYRENLLELASLYEDAKQPDEAVAIYHEFPDNVAAQEHLGQLMLENKKYADALPNLQEAYQKDPSQANLVALGMAYLFNRHIDKALPLFEKAVSAESGNYDLHMAYARALRDSRQFPASARQFLEAAKLKPGDASTWSELGGVLYMTGDLPQSLAAFDKARQLGEDTPGNWFLRAIILDKLKQLQPALDAYQQFLARSQGKSPDQEFQARQRSKLLRREIEKR
jgi:Tfp pilus assembly protein PilF